MEIMDAIIFGFFILLFGSMFILLPFMILRGNYIDTEYDDVCKYHYGTEYTYIEDEYFGTYCIELIHENLTMENPKPFDWTWEEVGKICGRPNDFDLTKWDSERCHGEFAYEVDHE